MKLYAVLSSGPTLGGVVALFDSEFRAEDYATMMNQKEAFSASATKDAYGISKAYLMGDGRHHVRTIGLDTFAELLDIFEWD